MKLSSLFECIYGTNLALNHLDVSKGGINFVSRISHSNGVSTTVEPLDDVEPLDAGLISVAVGGSVLSSFVQFEPFYTGRDVYYLKPKKPMSLKEKLFYCLCIKSNSYRYSYGRQANKTLGLLEVPDTVPAWVQNSPMFDFSHVSKPFLYAQVEKTSLHDKKWKSFRYESLFNIKKGKRVVNEQMTEGHMPCIRPTKYNNGVSRFIDIAPNHSSNTITVSYNGSVGEAFYQPLEYFAVDDINILYPKFKLNMYIAMFVITLIKLEKYRYNYGRKWRLESMNKSIIKLPVNVSNEPDWQFMENYIKSLPYSGNLENAMTV